MNEKKIWIQIPYVYTCIILVNNIFFLCNFFLKRCKWKAKKQKGKYVYIKIQIKGVPLNGEWRQR